MATPLVAAPRTADTDDAVARDVKHLLARGDAAAARRKFGELVERTQRRASRVAYLYLHDAAEADEAVQDAYVKVFTHIAGYREEVPFRAWFTRILINGCLDRLKTRHRRDRWMVALPDHAAAGGAEAQRVSLASSPERMLLRRERGRQVRAAIEHLPARQRDVVLLTHFDDRPTREVSEILGLKESTVRVHLFRALRRLRTLLPPS